VHKEELTYMGRIYHQISVDNTALSAFNF